MAELEFWKFQSEMLEQIAKNDIKNIKYSKKRNIFNNNNYVIQLNINILS